MANSVPAFLPPLSLADSTYGVYNGLKSSLFHHLATRQSSPPNSSTTDAENGGLLSGVDPTAINMNDPLRLWIIQLGIIMLTVQLLGLGLRRIKQPKVIAEVLGGIVLGPTLFGRIPGFTDHIFPKDSIPFLSLIANIGLVLFLFLVGMEIETTSIRRNARSSLYISLGGMCLPFAIGAGMSKLIYEKYVFPDNPNTPFTHFMLFTCVAYSITAFPVLCRILTELKLLDTVVGVCVLSAGVGNDIVGWTLLALSVALVNASSGITALYIVLLAVAWALVIIFFFRRVFAYIARRTCNLHAGHHNTTDAEPSIMFMTITLLFVFASAFLTDVIGVHAIFGGFLAGLVVPREGGLAIKMTEKIEDLYFALSGLSTNLGLLNTGEIWGTTIAIVVTAWIGKFCGATTGAKLAGFKLRESATVGCLMSCKGLIELIVLNVGLQAGILPVRVFSMFVLEALALTFATTPSVVVLYPPHVRTKAVTQLGASVGAGGGDEKAGAMAKGVGEAKDREKGAFGGVMEEGAGWGRVTMVLDRLEHLSGILVVGELLRGCGVLERSAGATTLQAVTQRSPSLKERLAEKISPSASAESTLKTTEDEKDASLNERGNDKTLVDNTLAPTLTHSLEKQQISAHMLPSLHTTNSYTTSTQGDTVTAAGGQPVKRNVTFTALRILELTDRTSAVMRSLLDASSLMLEDPLLRIFKTVSELASFSGVVKNVLRVENVDKWANAVHDVQEQEVEECGSIGRSMVVLCSLGPGVDETSQDDNPGILPNPFEYFFRNAGAPTPGAVTPVIQATHSGHNGGDSDSLHTHFIRSVFAKCESDVCLFVDQSSSPSGGSPMGLGSGGHTTFFLPFFGGPDDRVALDMLVQICSNKGRKAKGVVVRMTKGEPTVDVEDELVKPEPAYFASYMNDQTIESVQTPRGNMPDTVYGQCTTATRLQSRTADELAWEKYTSPTSPQYIPPFSPESNAIDISFREVTSPTPLATLVTLAHEQANPPPSFNGNIASRSRGKLLVVLGRSRRLAVESHHAELKAILHPPPGSPDVVGSGGVSRKPGHVSSDVRKMLGDVGTAMIASGVHADLMVLQAGKGGVDFDI